VCELLQIGPSLSCWCAREHEYLHQLVYLAAPHEERLTASAKLGEDAADASVVNCLAVFAHSEEDLRRAIPKSRYLASILLLGFKEGRPRQTEVGDLYHIILREQNVLRLQVSMEDPLRMAVRNAL